MLYFFQSSLIPGGDCYAGVQKAIQQRGNWETQSLLISMTIESAAAEPNLGLIPQWLAGSAPPKQTQSMATSQESNPLFTINGICNRFASK